MVGSLGRSKGGGGSSATAVDQQRNDNNANDGNATTPEATVSTMATNAATNDRQSRDEFLRAAMRIFLVVSPPVGRIQVSEE